MSDAVRACVRKHAVPACTVAAYGRVGVPDRGVNGRCVAGGRVGFETCGDGAGGCGRLYCYGWACNATLGQTPRGIIRNGEGIFGICD